MENEYSTRRDVPSTPRNLTQSEEIVDRVYGILQEIEIKLNPVLVQGKGREVDKGVDGCVLVGKLQGLSDFAVNLKDRIEF